MSKKLKTVGFAAGLCMMAATSVSAATIDFTANNDTTGSVLGVGGSVVGWTVSTHDNDTLTNATHGNNVGCTGQGWDFACAGDGPYDVGFGINGDGTNNNEIDGLLGDGFRNEFVQVKFDEIMQITGFAGMLTYASSTPILQSDRERVALQYKVGDGWESVLAEPLFIINDDLGGSGSFNTVGLAFSSGLRLFTDTVRFRARGVGDADDDTFNVTAAGLQVAPVPLPAAGFLLFGALGGLAALRRRRKPA